MCCVEDEALEALKHKDRVLERDELDAHNSSMRPETFNEVVARLYNDPELELWTEALPELHITFAEPIDCSFEFMPGGKISVEDVKKKLSDARAKLTQVRSDDGGVSVTSVFGDATDHDVRHWHA